LNMDLLMERMKQVLSKKKHAAVKWRALVGIDGDAAPNDGTPHSLLKAVELAASTIADFAKAVSKYGKVIKDLMTKSKKRKEDSNGKAIIKALDPKQRHSLGAEGKLLRELLEESESDTGLWAAAERAVQDLRVQPPAPDKIKASLEAVVKFTKTELKIGGVLVPPVAKLWAAYQVQLQALLRQLGVLKVDFGKAFSYSLSTPVPPVAGFQLTPYIRASVNFDHDAPAQEKGGPPSLEISASMVVGMDYAARGSSGSVAEIAFSPVMDLVDGLQQDSLVPTISFLGSDPIPISSDPMVRTPFHVQIYV